MGLAFSYTGESNTRSMLDVPSVLDGPSMLDEPSMLGAPKLLDALSMFDMPSLDEILLNLEENPDYYNTGVSHEKFMELEQRE